MRYISIIKSGEDPQSHRTSYSYTTSVELLLPCEYFDYIAGTGTGGCVISPSMLRYTSDLISSLIAIMLGRRRLGVGYCIRQFQRIIENVYQQPRLRSIRGSLSVYRTKYSDKKMMKAIEEIVADGSHYTKFRADSTEGCKT